MPRRILISSFIAIFMLAVWWLGARYSGLRLTLPPDNAESMSSDFLLRVAGDCCVHKLDTAGRQARTLYRLVYVTDEWDRPATVFKDRPWDSVPSVSEVGVHEATVFGKTTEGYFICDAVSDRGDPSRAGANDLFLDSSESAWRAELTSRDVPTELTLKSPDAWAATRPDRELRPWRYRFLGGVLDLSDEDWSNEVQLTFLGASFLVGLLRKRREGLWTTAIWLGIGANVIGPMILGGGGPVGFVGFFILPLEAVFLAWVGRHLRRFANRQTRPAIPENP